MPQCLPGGLLVELQHGNVQQARASGDAHMLPGGVAAAQARPALAERGWGNPASCVQAPNQDALCFRDEFEEWEAKHHCKVITSTRDTFQGMFDDDDTLAYEPASTAAIILTGGDEEAEAAALAVSPQLPLLLESTRHSKCADGDSHLPVSRRRSQKHAYGGIHMG